MDIALLLILAVLCMIMALFMGKATMWATWAPSPLFVFVVCSVLFVNLGFIVYFLRGDQQRWEMDGLLNVSLGLMAVAVGATIGRQLFKTRVPWKSIGARAIREDITFREAMIVGCVVFATAVVPFVWRGNFPLLAAITQIAHGGLDASVLSIQRNLNDPFLNQDTQRIPLQGLFDTVRYLALPVVGVWFLHYYARRIHRRMSLGMVLVAVFLVILTGQRWPLMYMLTTFLLYWSWTTSNQSRLLRRTAAVLAVASCAGIVLSILLARSLEGSPTVLEAVVYGVGDLGNRILFGNVQVPYASYDLYPAQEGYLLGQSYLQNLQAFLPWDSSPSFPVTFYQVVTGDQSPFTAPPDLYTEGFINFGILGAVVVGFAFGIIMSALQKAIIESHRISQVAWMALLCALCGFASFGGFAFLLGGLVAMGYVRASLAVVKLLCRRAAGTEGSLRLPDEPIDPQPKRAMVRS